MQISDVTRALARSLLARGHAPTPEAARVGAVGLVSLAIPTSEEGVRELERHLADLPAESAADLAGLVLGTWLTGGEVRGALRVDAGAGGDDLTPEDLAAVEALAETGARRLRRLTLVR